jgi:hypothetical protein
MTKHRHFLDDSKKQAFMNTLKSPAGSLGVVRCATAVLAGLCATAFLFSSCQNEKDTPDPRGSIILNMAGMSRAVSDHVQIYLFNGVDDANRGKFNRELIQIERDDDLLTASEVPVGTWDIALVTTADGSGMNRIVDPVGGQFRAQQKMFELTSSGGVLPQAPEIMTGRVDAQSIVAGVLNTAPPPVLLARNVAMVRVTIKNPGGYDPDGQHKLTLGNISTTLNWEGQLLPSRTAPSTTGAGVGLKGEFEITGSGGGQACDTLTFIVPAHKSANPTDTTTSKLDISVDLLLSSGSRYVKGPVTIPVVPRANGIIEISLIPKQAELDVEFAVTPWNYKKNDVVFE